jgi:iron(III) transport system substrate-binding protein
MLRNPVFINVLLAVAKWLPCALRRSANWVGSLVLAWLWILVSVGCDRSGGPEAASAPVVVYSSVDEVYARPVLEAFTRQTGVPVKLVSDSEETKSTGLLNRLLAERARPQADVFWSGDPIRAAVLTRRGVSAPYRSSQAVGLPGQFSDPGGHFTAFSARVRVIIYNTNLVRAAERPTSVFDLAHARFRGRACLANPLFGTTSMHAAALFQSLGEAKAREFFTSLTRNEVKMLSSNGEVRRRVAAGDFAIGLTDSDDVHVAMKDGQPVSFALPDQQDLGTLLVPNAVVLIAGAPNADGGRKLIDYLLSEAVERELAVSDAAQVPLRVGLPPPAWLGGTLPELRLMAVDYSRLAAQLEVLQDGFLKTWVDQQTSRGPSR